MTVGCLFLAKGDGRGEYLVDATELTELESVRSPAVVSPVLTEGVLLPEPREHFQQSSPEWARCDRDRDRGCRCPWWMTGGGFRGGEERGNRNAIKDIKQHRNFFDFLILELLFQAD